MNNEIVIYQSEMLSNHIEVRVEGETVWLNRLQLADLFDRDVKTIGKHISNALKEELEGIAVVAKFATTASDGKTYQVVKGDACDGCCILHDHCFSIKESLGPCVDVSRTDKTSIIFKEINNKINIK